MGSNNSILGKIQGYAQGMRERQERERNKFFEDVPLGHDIRKGILELLTEQNLNVRLQSDDEVVVPYEGMEVFVKECGSAALCFSEGHVFDFEGDEFRRLYTHLRAIYEENRKRRDAPVPF